MRRPRPRPRPPALLPLLAALVACSPLGPGDARVRVRVREQPPFVRQIVEAGLDDGRFYWHLLGTDLEPAGEPGLWQSREIRVGTSRGPVEVVVAVRAPDGTVASGVELSLEASGDNRWLVDVLAAPSSAAVTCAGCASRAAAMPPELRAAGDSLVVVWRDLRE